MHENTRLAVMEDIKKLANTKFELLPSFFSFREFGTLIISPLHYDTRI